MAIRHTLTGGIMTGFRKESFYVEKYGQEIGIQKYNLVIWWNNNENK